MASLLAVALLGWGKATTSSGLDALGDTVHSADYRRFRKRSDSQCNLLRVLFDPHLRDDGLIPLTYSPLIENRQSLAIA